MSLRRVARREWLALAAVMVVASALRLLTPGADLPWELERTNAPIQDAFWYLEAAAGPIDGSTPESMPDYDLPVWSPLARTWFRLWGASLASAHTLSATLALLALLLFWRIVRAGLGPVAAISSVAVLAVHYPSVGLSRTSLIYGPALLPLLLAAALWLSARGRPLAIRLVLEGAAWAIVVGATIAARPPLAALIGGILLAHLVRSSRARWPLLLLGAGGALALGLFLLDARIVLEPLASLQHGGGWLGETAGRLLRYLPRRLDVAELLARALEWGSEPGQAVALQGRESTTSRGTGVFALAPIILSVAAVGLGWAALDACRLPDSARETLALFVGWGAALIGGSLLLDHRPLRYFALLAPSVAILAGYTIARVAHATRVVRPGAASRAEIATAALIGAFLLPHLADLVGLVSGRAGLDAAYRNWRTTPADPTFQAAILQAQAARDQALFLTAVLGLGAGALALGSRRLILERLPAAGPRLGLVLLLLTLLPSTLRSAGSVASPTWSAHQANRLTAQLTHASATIVGPSASFLCLGVPRRRLRGSWLFTGDAYIERTFEQLDRRAVTHIALDLQQARSARLTSQFAKHGRKLALVAVLRILRPGTPRESLILLYRLPKAEERGYRCTPYEERRKGDQVNSPLDARAREPSLELRRTRVRTLIFLGALDRAKSIAKN